MPRIEKQNNIIPQGFCIVGCDKSQQDCQDWTDCLASVDLCKKADITNANKDEFKKNCGSCQRVINKVTSTGQGVCIQRSQELASQYTMVSESRRGANVPGGSETLREACQSSAENIWVNVLPFNESTGKVDFNNDVWCGNQDASDGEFFYHLSSS